MSVFAGALVLAGLWLLGLSLQHPNFYSIVRGAAISVVLLSVGVYMLWDDLLRSLVERSLRK